MLNQKEDNEIIEIKLSSNIKTAESQGMEQELMDLANSTAKKLSLDFQEVTFICSHFLKVCLKLNNALTTERFHLQKLNPEIKKVFMIAGFDRILSIKDS
jgi:anti-anti-sigma factor